MVCAKCLYSQAARYALCVWENVKCAIMMYDLFKSFSLSSRRGEEDADPRRYSGVSLLAKVSSERKTTTTISSGSLVGLIYYLFYFTFAPLSSS